MQAFIVGFVLLATPDALDKHFGRAALYLLLAFGTVVTVALARSFDWSWIALWLYRLSLVLNVVLVVVLGNLTDAGALALATILCVSAFLAGVYSGGGERD